MRRYSCPEMKKRHVLAGLKCNRRSPPVCFSKPGNTVRDITSCVPGIVTGQKLIPGKIGWPDPRIYPRDVGISA